MHGQLDFRGALNYRNPAVAGGQTPPPRPGPQHGESCRGRRKVQGTFSKGSIVVSAADTVRATMVPTTVTRKHLAIALAATATANQVGNRDDEASWDCSCNSRKPFTAFNNYIAIVPINRTFTDHLIFTTTNHPPCDCSYDYRDQVAITTANEYFYCSFDNFKPYYNRHIKIILGYFLLRSTKWPRQTILPSPDRLSSPPSLQIPQQAVLRLLPQQLQTILQSPQHDLARFPTQWPRYVILQSPDKLSYQTIL